MIKCIEISLKSFESKLIQNAVLQISSVIPHELEFSQFSFPRTLKKFTVLRSPHIDKKSREQFQIQYFKNIIRLKTQKNKETLSLRIFQLFVENLKHIQCLGVQMKIRIVYTTFLEKS